MHGFVLSYLCFTRQLCSAASPHTCVIGMCAVILSLAIAGSCSLSSASAVVRKAPVFELYASGLQDALTHFEAVCQADCAIKPPAYGGTQLHRAEKLSSRLSA